MGRGRRTSSQVPLQTNTSYSSDIARCYLKSLRPCVAVVGSESLEEVRIMCGLMNVVLEWIIKKCVLVKIGTGSSDGEGN